MTTAIDRSAFDLDPNLIYVNHAAIGVLPISAREALHRYLDAHCKRGVVGVAAYELKLPENRARFGRFIGAEADEVAFVRNTSEAANILARALPLQAGDEILTNDNEFGANAHPWLALRENGVAVRFIETNRERMTPDVLRRHITPNTRVVTLSWVSFIDGYRHDLAALAEIAHAHNAYIMVDAIQGLGAFPFSMRELDLDAVYGGAQKWMLGEPGLGYLCVRNRILDRLHVRLPGWRSVEDIWDFLNYDQPFFPGAARFEGGTPNLIGIAALMESVDLLDAAGVRFIGEHIHALTARLREGLTRLGAEIATIMGRDCESGILTYRFPDIDPVITGQALAKAGVVTTNRSNGIRISPHGYNTMAEIDAIINIMAEHRKDHAARA